MKPKIWLCGITSEGNENNLKEMISPIIEHFDGLQFTFHVPMMDSGAKFLEANKKRGKIVYANWCQRHGYSMTHFLWQGTMKEGDYFVVLDTYERISNEFASRLQNMVEYMKNADIAIMANYGKGFAFKYSETLRFEGSPHWYPVNFEGKVGDLQISKNDFWNVRDEQRGEFHFVKHYLKYYLYPRGSNHCLLGLEKNGNPNELFPKREANRIKFLSYLEENNIPKTVESVIEILQNPTERLKVFINSEKILNDAYRYLVLRRYDFKDDHDFKNMIFVG